MEANPSWRARLHALTALAAAFGWVMASVFVSAAAFDVDNERSAITSVLESGESEWRLLGLTLPNQQTLNIDFREVQLFAPDAAVLRPLNDGFERLPREPLRVFVGDSAAASEGVAVLIERADGRLQGSWQNQGARYELNMGLSEAEILAVDRPAEVVLGNPFASDEVRPEINPASMASKAQPVGRRCHLNWHPFARVPANSRRGNPRR